MDMSLSSLHPTLNTFFSRHWGNLPTSPSLYSDDKILNVEYDETEHKYLIELKSDGLSLDDKIYLEKTSTDLAQYLSDEQNNPDPKISFYFKRTTHQTTPPVDLKKNRVQKAGPRSLPQVKNVVAVLSGKGGVGKSTVSLLYALSLLKAGYRVGILDADILGPSMHHMLGTTHLPAVGPERKLHPVTASGLSLMSFGFFNTPDTPALWRGPMLVKALRQLVFDVSWPELDVLVLDLPPGTGDVQLSLLEELKIDHAIIVTTSSPIAVIDAKKSHAMMTKHNIPILAIIDNLSTHTCVQCGHIAKLFETDDDLGMTAKLPVLSLPYDKTIHDALSNKQASLLSEHSALNIFSPTFSCLEQ